MRDLELWGGHECTVNRVGELFFDQTVRSGHHARLSDLDHFASLGLRALRFPVLWERTSPDPASTPDWRWSDERLSRLRELNVRPIVGLLHHGSGPRYTSLLDPSFAEGLACFAGKVARRYPHVMDWTPVNEPLTTARFSALYGHWYPHSRDEKALWMALLNQVDAIRGAMKAIRAVNPEARLVQTEDLGRTYATSAVAHQASFDNERRWLTWDLLEGRVTRSHPLGGRLQRLGFGDRLSVIEQDPCPADVVGVNHYLTSDRFLDHRTELYPPERIGGNAFLSFADVEAVRVIQPGPDGTAGALEEAWTRYRRPVALTECHNGCTREEQMRWLQEAWDGIVELRARGVEVEALTIWSLLGAFDWDSLLTRADGHYESGVFDLRGGNLRPTALAGLVRNLAAGQRMKHPALDQPGWWRRDVRLAFQPVFRSVDDPEPRRSRRNASVSPRPILIVGATGTLGKAFARTCEWRGLDYVLVDRRQLSLDHGQTIQSALDLYRPWAVINAAGWVRVDDAETDPEGCIRVNTHGALMLATNCAHRETPIVSFSSDLVFDGKLERPYLEADAPCPLNVYGRSKAELERQVLQLGGPNLLVRTAAFFSPFDPHNFAAQVTRGLVGGQEVRAACDIVISPTYVPDLVDATLDLLIDGETGLWHLVNGGALSWCDFARAIADALRLDTRLIAPTPATSFDWPAQRPRFAPLVSSRGALLPPLEGALERYAGRLRAAGFTGDPADLPGDITSEWRPEKRVKSTASGPRP